MPENSPKSFAEVTFIEAAARRLRADLVISPVTPDGQTRLISRFAGVEGPGRVILEPPVTADGGKVFIPDGWELGISFDLANVWFQATTRVLEHCMFYQAPTRRIDALAVKLPAKVLTGNRRAEPRHAPPPGGPTFVTIWPGGRIDDEDAAPLATGRLQDWSASGVGIRLTEPLDLATGAAAVLCLTGPSGGESVFLRGVLRHCTSLGDGTWVAGLGDAAGLRPGEAVSLMSLLAGPAGGKGPTR